MFAGLVREHRRRLGMTQEGLAESCGLSVRSIRKIETGQTIAPRPATVRLLADALGLAGPDLERFCRAATSSSDAPGPAAGRRSPVPPRQLPAPPQVFAGRADEIAGLDLVDQRGGTVAVATIDGMAGVGKTALALHWAHRVADRFPDGQLYVDLRGYASSPPLTPIEALAGFLHALGLRGGDIPIGLDEAAAAYRSLLASKRMLVVLDNARDVHQVRPLLPAGAGCLAVVTSRDRLGGLVASDGAYRIGLGVLSAAEAESMLARVLGTVWVQAEPQAAAELARLCGYLPLALRIAAANLALRPGQRIADQVERLRDQDRLAALTVDGDPHCAVATAFDLSYGRLSNPARRMFRLLGLVPGPDVTVGAAAALAGTTTGEAAGLLELLARNHLVTESANGRYACHDLLREYAADRGAHEDAAPARDAARHRLLGWYLHATQTAADILYPGMLRLPPGQTPEVGPSTRRFHDSASAQAWLEAERTNLVAAISHAAEHGPPPVAWHLAHSLRGFWMQRSYLVDGLAATAAALAAARKESDLFGQAATMLSRGVLYAFRGDNKAAWEHAEATVDLARRAGWNEAQAAALGNSALAQTRLGQLDQAVARLTEALALDRRLGCLGGAAANLNNLGGIYLERGHLQRAAECFAESLALFRRLRAPEAASILPLNNLGCATRDLGRMEEALGHVTKALSLSREYGHRPGEANALDSAAILHRDAGRYTQALAAADAAIRAADDVGDNLADTYNTRGSVHCRMGRPRQALDDHRYAIELARRAEDPASEADALLGLAAAHRALRRHDHALSLATEALDLARRRGYRLREGQALTVLAQISLDRRDDHHARKHADQALDNHMETGYRLGEARTHQVLGEICEQTGDAHAARHHRQQAHSLLVEIGAPEAGRPSRRTT